jgi:hypothetical protein
MWVFLAERGEGKERKGSREAFGGEKTDVFCCEASKGISAALGEDVWCDTSQWMTLGHTAWGTVGAVLM